MKNNLQINNILQNFTPIYLDEMEKVTLMDRVDNKFIFSISTLADLLNDCLKEYRILEINNIRNHLYESLYFDTSDYLMYLLHHNQHLNRYKVRFRKYISSNGLTFFEIKFKNNKEKTYKKRKKYNDIQFNIENELKNFLITNTPYQPENLFPSLKIQYYRITLVHQNFHERVTIDTQLSFDNFSHKTDYENIVMVEVKRSNYAINANFFKILKKHNIREGGLSKYCTGIALCNPIIKKNNFLPKLRYFDKINSLC